MNHHPDLTAGVMAGLSWFYLCAGLMNACAAGYISFSELVSEGACREGLTPKTRFMPAWLKNILWVFYGLGGLVAILNPKIGF
ncbi:MAG: hypothetical protein ACKO5E_14550, partial [bacterium]